MNLTTQNQENPKKNERPKSKKKLLAILKIKNTLVKRWHGGGIARSALVFVYTHVETYGYIYIYI